MSSPFFTTNPAKPITTVQLNHVDVSAEAQNGQMLPLPARIARCQSAVAAFVEREGLPVARKSGRLVLITDDGLQTLTRHEVAALLAQAVAFQKFKPSGDFDPSDPPGNLVSAVFAHPPESLPEMGDRPDARISELWAAFLAGWWTAHENGRVSVGKLAAMPGLDDLAPIIGNDLRGRRVALGRMLGERAGLPVEIEPEPAERLTVKPIHVGVERSGAKVYLLDPQHDREPVPA